MFNLLMAAVDDDDETTDGTLSRLMRNYRRMWKEGKLRILEVDITPIYNALGGDSGARKYFSVAGHFRDPVKFVLHPVQSAKHKGSTFTRIVSDSLTGTDWADRPFTSWDELLGVDDKGIYRTSGEGRYPGDPKGGKLAGQTVSWSSTANDGVVTASTVPSFVLNQARGIMPIPVQNLLAYFNGEMDGFDAITKSMGLMVSTTRTAEEELQRNIKKGTDISNQFKDWGARIDGAAMRRKDRIPLEPEQRAVLGSGEDNRYDRVKKQYDKDRNKAKELQRDGTKQQELGNSDASRQLFDKAKELLRKADLALVEYLEKAEARYESRLITTTTRN